MKVRQKMPAKGYKKISDLTKLKELMRLKPTLADTAAFFECSERTVERTIREHWDLSFVEFREQNMVHTRLNLVRTAIKKALGGDNTMLIFCLKNLCKWQDRFEQDFTNTKPIELKYKLDDGKEDKK